MIHTDLFAFSDIFNSLQRVLGGRKLDETERQRMLGDYFRALRSYPIDAVRAGAERCMATAKHFPRPMEWAEVIPRQSAGADCPTITAAELNDYRDADASGGTGFPCGCQPCREAGVDRLPLRFVPECEADGSDRRRLDPSGGRIVVTGHWAHGQELAGYSRAKEAFLTEAHRLFNAGRVPRVLVPR